MSAFTGEFASARSMDWEEFISATSRADIAPRVGFGMPRGLPHPDQVVRFGLPRDRRGPQQITLRVVPNNEHVLIFAADGAIAWLRTPPRVRTLGYFVVAVDVPPHTNALFLASFRKPKRVPTTIALVSEQVRLAYSDWIGPKDAEHNPEGDDARMQVQRLHHLLSTGFLLLEGAPDPRDALLPAVSLRIEAPAMASVSEPEPTPVSAFASARMPADVVTNVAFTVDVGFDGPEAPARVEWERLLIDGLDPDQLVTVKVLRVRNVEVAEGCPDSVDFPVPEGKVTQLANFTLVAPASGPVEVHLRFRQDGVTVGLLRLLADAQDSPGGPSPMTEDNQPFQTRPPRERVLEISVGTSSDGDHLGVEYDLTLDGEAHSWTRTIATDIVLSHLQTTVEERWTSALSAHPNCPHDRDTAFADEMRILGATLFQDLVPDELRQLMVADPDRFDGLMIVTNEPRIPWEVACIADGEGDTPERFFAELGVVRGISGVVPKSRIRVNPARSWFLVPDYRRRLPELPSVSAERDFLTRTLHATPISPPSVTAVTSLLAQRDYDLFHFAGHGATSELDRERQVILLMGAGGRGPVPFSPRDLESALRDSSVDPNEATGRVVVLNACHSGALWSETSGFAVAFVRGGADIFIGAQWSVADDSAAFFASAFYLALLSGAPVHTAAANARDEARSAGDSGWIAYAVYADPDATVEFDPVIL